MELGLRSSGPLGLTLGPVSADLGRLDLAATVGDRDHESVGVGVGERAVVGDLEDLRD